MLKTTGQMEDLAAQAKQLLGNATPSGAGGPATK
jgi:hypothetical protein